MKLGFGSSSLFLTYSNILHIVYEGALRPDSPDPSVLGVDQALK